MPLSPDLAARYVAEYERREREIWRILLDGVVDSLGPDGAVVLSCTRRTASISTTSRSRVRLPFHLRSLTVMHPKNAIDVAKDLGVVLESTHGPVPNVAEIVAGEPIAGSWWNHPRASEIFAVTRALRSSPEILTCLLLDGRITLVHRRLWPALVRLAGEIGRDRLTAVREVHTREGFHRREDTPFPDWAPRDVPEAAESMSEDGVRAQIGDLLALLGDGEDPSR
jgi:hypothetical protein